MADIARRNKVDRLLFGGNREKALERDGYKCVSCGMSNDEHISKYGDTLNVDHIDGNGVGTPAHKRNNSLDNLQTLCRYCHGKKDGHRHWYEGDVTRKEGFCKRGHRMTDEATYRYPDGRVECRVCRKQNRLFSNRTKGTELVVHREVKHVPIEYRYYSDGLVEMLSNGEVIRSLKLDRPPVVLLDHVVVEERNRDVE